MVNLSQILHAGKNTEIQTEKGTEKGKCKNAIMQKYKNREMKNGKACDIWDICKQRYFLNNVFMVKYTNVR